MDRERMHVVPKAAQQGTSATVALQKVTVLVLVQNSQMISSNWNGLLTIVQLILLLSSLHLLGFCILRFSKSGAGPLELPPQSHCLQGRNIEGQVLQV